MIVGAATTSDPWISDNALFGHYDYYFYLNAAILALAFLVYLPVSRAYVERPIDGATHSDSESDASAEERAEALKKQRRLKFEDHAGAHLNPEDNAVIGLDKH
jgi:hypothetical protein